MRVYGIGLSKTGTRSLTEALTILMSRKAYHGCDVGTIAARGAATDSPVAARYRALDELWPNSKFILTVRDEDEWIESLRKHCVANEIGQAPLALRLEYLSLRWHLYGFGERFNVDAARAGHRHHVAGVRQWFADKPDQLLELSICQGDGWESLCEFLGYPVPDKPFPWLGLTTKPALQANGDGG